MFRMEPVDWGEWTLAARPMGAILLPLSLWRYRMIMNYFSFTATNTRWTKSKKNVASSPIFKWLQYCEESAVPWRALGEHLTLSTAWQGKVSSTPVSSQDAHCLETIDLGEASKAILRGSCLAWSLALLFHPIAFLWPDVGSEGMVRF